MHQPFSAVGMSISATKSSIGGHSAILEMLMVDSEKPSQHDKSNMNFFVPAELCSERILPNY
jgi:hypothetical protein